MSSKEMEDTETLSVEDISGSEEDLESLPESMPEQSEMSEERAPRWDQKEKPLGKQPRNYHSWRAHKFKILSCLGASGNNVAFTRRYMLFREGVNLPNNIIHYYNSRYRSKTEAQAQTDPTKGPKASRR
ncbi:22K [Canine mastadenovirus A]|uniref:22K n=3 Tax=Canine mastadenovirus A TaxID=10537 RepID=A0A6S6MFC3_9ADEN|nr:22K [Canine adenovirus 2]AAB38729.1 putative L4-22 kDa protein [Canine adenovirus 2]QJS39034.1 putative L4-22 kDa protein [Canine adenovirus 2]BCG66244.1 22K [Canine mastadenovirus A]